MTDKITKAWAFCVAAHRAVGQKRKYTGEPYEIHPFQVAALVRTTESWTQDMICAALLHDVVEDTQVDLQAIDELFGLQVCQLVYWLTDVSTPEDGNRAARKALDREHIAQAPAEAQTIKLADLICNSESIVKHDPKFAEVYLSEKRLLLGVLHKGDARLWDMADKILRENGK